MSTWFVLWSGGLTRPQVSLSGGAQVPHSIGLAFDEFIQMLVRCAEVDITLARVLRAGTYLMTGGLQNRSG